MSRSRAVFVALLLATGVGCAGSSGGQSGTAGAGTAGNAGGGNTGTGGLMTKNSAISVNATDNWWGCTTGPGGAGKKVHISGYEEWRFGADGLVEDSLGHFDAAEYARQLTHGYAA